MLRADLLQLNSDICKHVVTNCNDILAAAASYGWSAGVFTAVGKGKKSSQVRVDSVKLYRRAIFKVRIASCI
jgi:hypothetical protein